MASSSSSAPDALMFDLWAVSSGPSLAAITEQTLALLREADTTLRTRAPRGDAAQRVEAVVSTIVANLAMLHLGKTGRTLLAVPMKNTKRTRYDRHGFSVLPDTVNHMADLGLILKHPGVFKRLRTTIAPTGRLLDALSRPNVSLGDVGQADGRETIALSIRGQPGPMGRLGNSEPRDYADTEETMRLRQEMKEVNDFLRSQRIELHGQPQGGFTLYRAFTLRRPSDPPSFNLHGRLYGAFWINLPARERDGGLTINGEPIADLDFPAMFPRLAYARAGVVPPAGDLYAIPGLEGHRDGAKKGLSAMLSSPSGMLHLPPGLGEFLPKGWTASHLKAAVAAKHPALVPLFGQDLSLEFMFTESRILLAAMGRLRSQGIPALPMHDGVMVPDSGKEQAKEAMEGAAKEVTGVEMTVTEKATLT